MWTISKKVVCLKTNFLKSQVEQNPTGERLKKTAAISV